MFKSRCAVVLCVALAFTWSSYADDRKVTVDVHEEELAKVLDDLGKQANVKIALKGEGRTPVTLTLKEVDLETAIKYVCVSAGAEYKKDGNAFEVNNPNPLPGELEKTGTQSTTTDPNLLLIADFKAGGAQNNLGGHFGTFNAGKEEAECKASLSFVEEDALERKEGKAAKIEFDNQGKPFWSGLWLCTNEMQNEDLGAYDRLVFRARTESLRSLVIVVKDRTAKDDDSNEGVGTIPVSGLTEKWQKFEVPFKDFRPKAAGGHLNWKSVRQFVFVCYEGERPSKGTLYLDEVCCAKGSPAEKQ